MLDKTGRTALYKEALKQYGAKHQLVIVMEELSELTKELSKEYRGIGSREALIEELADVVLMTESLEYILNCPTGLAVAIQKKAQKLKNHLYRGK